jgi:RNA polymerase sigma-70 factor (ECF subfamily)
MSETGTEEATAAAEDDGSAALMRRLRGGDDLALNGLIERWQRPLLSFLLRYTGNEQDALDLAQECFVRVYEQRHRYEPRGKFSAWLYTIAANLSRNQARWRERHPTVSLHAAAPDETGLEESLPADGPTPADNAEWDDLASAVRAHIQALPHDLRTAILLFEYQDLGYEEIALALGCSAKAVETRLYRARNLLRQSLNRWKAE